MSDNSVPQHHKDQSVALLPGIEEWFAEHFNHPAMLHTGPATAEDTDPQRGVYVSQQGSAAWVPTRFVVGHGDMLLITSEFRRDLEARDWENWELKNWPMGATVLVHGVAFSGGGVFVRPVLNRHVVCEISLDLVSRVRAAQEGGAE